MFFIFSYISFYIAYYFSTETLIPTPFTFRFLYCKNKFALSGYTIPTKLKVSFIRLAFIFKSKGESNAKEGDRLISNNHGLI